MPIPLRSFIEILEEILRGRLELIQQLQALVWDRAGEITGLVELDDKLRELALDLDYFESDERIRAEDPSLYGNERLAAEIASVLRELKAASLKR